MKSNQFNGYTGPQRPHLNSHNQDDLEYDDNHDNEDDVYDASPEEYAPYNEQSRFFDGVEYKNSQKEHNVFKDIFFRHINKLYKYPYQEVKEKSHPANKNSYDFNKFKKIFDYSFDNIYKQQPPVLKREKYTGYNRFSELTSDLLENS